MRGHPPDRAGFTGYPLRTRQASRRSGCMRDRSPGHIGSAGAALCMCRSGARLLDPRQRNRIASASTTRRACQAACLSSRMLKHQPGYIGMAGRMSGFTPASHGAAPRAPLQSVTCPAASGRMQGRKARRCAHPIGRHGRDVACVPSDPTIGSHAGHLPGRIAVADAAVRSRPCGRTAGRMADQLPVRIASAGAGCTRQAACSSGRMPITARLRDPVPPSARWPPFPSQYPAGPFPLLRNGVTRDPRLWRGPSP